MRNLLATTILSASALAAPAIFAIDTGSLLFSNSEDNGSYLIVNDARGNTLSSGCMAVGQLSAEVVNGTIAEIFEDFSKQGNYLDLLLDGDNGNFFSSDAFSGAISDGFETFSGTLYFFIGNGENVASSTEFMLFKFQNLEDDSTFFSYSDLDESLTAEFIFATDDALKEGELEWAPRSAAEILGAIREMQDNTTLSINLCAVPEPCAFGAIAGICALAFAGTRRRRKIKS